VRFIDNSLVNLFLDHPLVVISNAVDAGHGDQSSRMVWPMPVSSFRRWYLVTRLILRQAANRQRS